MAEDVVALQHLRRAAVEEDSVGPPVVAEHRGLDEDVAGPRVLTALGRVGTGASDDDSQVWVVAVKLLSEGVVFERSVQREAVDVDVSMAMTICTDFSLQTIFTGRGLCANCTSCRPWAWPTIISLQRCSTAVVCGSLRRCSRWAGSIGSRRCRAMAWSMLLLGISLG